MALAMQQSLFEASGEAPMAESARWIEGVMLGEIALGVCVIAAAFIGALMLTGRLPLREGVRIVVGCFVLLGAPLITAGFVQGRGGVIEAAGLPPFAVQIENSRSNLPPADFDPYAGASLRED
ncbi:MAG: TrbC/VirB2 family protein [Methylophilaceae bacterium]|nr:TrbC/VirB2 family protein [Erythrobacter sp.]MDZ4097366.1 TrbC/VirB2 family protein [Methylophilaceae bacterium]MDZ4272674.1 TrbC/VirB2 family protein [Erythrobacter sp.]